MTRGITDATLAASRIVGAADINKLNATAAGDKLGLMVTLQASGGQLSFLLRAPKDERAAGTTGTTFAGMFNAFRLAVPEKLPAP